MAKKSAEQAMAELRAYYESYRRGNSADAPIARELERYLSAGALAGASPETLGVINAVIKDTDYKGQPGRMWYDVAHGNPNAAVAASNMPDRPDMASQTAGLAGAPPPSPNPPATGPTGAPSIGSETTPQSVGITPAQAAQNAASPALGVQAAGAPGGGPTFGPISGTPGAYTGPQSAAVQADPENTGMRQVLRALGVDPSHMGPMGQFIQQQFAPLFASWLAANPYQGGGDGTGAVDNTQSALAQFAKLLATPGAGAFGQFKNAAQAALSNPALGGQLTGLNDSGQQQKVLTQLQRLLYSGAGDLLQNSAAAQSKNAYADYLDANTGFAPNGQGGAQPPYTGLFYDWLNNGQGGKPDPRRNLFGLGQ